MKRLNWALVAFVLALALVGCRKAPSDVDFIEKVGQQLPIYLGADAQKAKAAMIELEAYAKHCEQAGSSGIKFLGHYGAIYSRLYLVEGALGEPQVASGYYAKAAEAMQKQCDEAHITRLSDEALRPRIEGVDRYFSGPEWKKNKSPH